MSSEIDLDDYRKRVFEALRAEGFPIDQWQREYEQDLAADPTARARPFTTITPPAYGKIQKLRPGFEEFVSHPRHGKPVPRCQASLKGSGGKTQCSKFALRGKHLCRTHGGAAGSGKLSEEGRQNQIASVTIHGSETIEKRRKRSEASKASKELARLAVKLGLSATTGIPRGPYFKPNRIGQPMAHLKRGNR